MSDENKASLPEDSKSENTEAKSEAPSEAKAETSDVKAEEAKASTSETKAEETKAETSDTKTEESKAETSDTKTEESKADTSDTKAEESKAETSDTKTEESKPEETKTDTKAETSDSKVEEVKPEEIKPVAKAELTDESDKKAESETKTETDKKTETKSETKIEPEKKAETETKKVEEPKEEPAPTPAAASKDEERLCRDDIRPPKMSPARKASEVLRKVVFGAAILVLVGSLLYLGKAGYDYLANYIEYKSLASQYASKDPNKHPGKDPKNPQETTTEPENQTQDPQNPTEEPKTEDAAEIQAILDKYNYTPLNVDFDALKEINSDVIGWIDIPAADISYPMVLGEDNDYYLRHTFKRIYNIGGAIFLDYRNAGDLSDPNTIIYGHNQDNGKMFSNLLDLTDAKEAKKCQLIVIYTPKETLYYQVFSVRIRNYMDPVYGVSYTSSELKAYGDNALFESQFNYNAISEFTDYDRIISLITCCEDQDYRLMVHGYLINNPEKEAAEKK